MLNLHGIKENSSKNYVNKLGFTYYSSNVMTEWTEDSPENYLFSLLPVEITVYNLVLCLYHI
jgi:hypothetical protein